MSRWLLIFLMAGAAAAQIRVVPLPGKSPLVTFRIVFTAGSAADPVEKPGLASLTARLLADGGTREMTYQQLSDALFPMAASVDVQVDHEMTTFSGAVHVDNLPEYYRLLRAMLLDPGWREDDFRRVREDAINALKVGLRANNDEELAKEVLYQNIYSGTAYGHYSGGTVSALENITLADVRQFYRTQYNQGNVILGIAGGFSENFLESMRKDFRTLPAGASLRPRISPPSMIDGTRVIVVDKETRSVAYSIGLPIVVTRNHPDYVPLLVAASYFGQHRLSGGLLYDEMREKRGLNYGDYAYIEYFPRGMFLMEPQPNLARRQQIFQMWIRPVEPPTAVFALRLALYELAKLVKDGLSQDAFERTRDFLGKYVNVLTRTKSAELGYAIDSAFYTMPHYDEHLKTALAKITRDDVNRVIRRYLRADRLVIVAVTKNGDELKRILAEGAPSPMTYNSPKPDAIREEDKTVEKWPLNLRPGDIRVVPLGEVFQ